MRTYYKISSLILVLFTITYGSELLYYLSPGLQIMYGKKSGLLFGVKMSIGAVHKDAVVNLTGGVLGGKQTEFYTELQLIPVSLQVNVEEVPFLWGGGIGVTFVDRPIESWVVFKPRVTVFAGSMLFSNATYRFFMPDDIAPFQLGSSLVFPLLLNP
jgi:hypothetical protein